MRNVTRGIGAVAAVLALTGGTAVLASAPAEATQVNNNMLCEPDTGWCYQTSRSRPRLWGRDRRHVW
jgi:hypothetical protein